MPEEPTKRLEGWNFQSHLWTFREGEFDKSEFGINSGHLFGLGLVHAPLILGRPDGVKGIFLSW